MHMKASGVNSSIKYVHSEDIDLDESGVVRFREIKKQSQWQNKLRSVIPKIIDMDSEDWAKVFIFANKKSMLKTPLQKALFLFNMRSGLPEELFGWKADNYGPYSREISNKIKASEGIVTKSKINKHSGITYIYKLKSIKDVEKVWDALPAEVKELIKEVSAEIKALHDVQKIENFTHDAYPKYAINAVC